MTSINKENLESYQITLTLDMIIEEYKNNNIDNYNDLSEFKLISLLLHEFPNIVISKNFPKYLLLDNFDLMLDIFADWDYTTMTDTVISRIINIFENAMKSNIEDYHIKNIFWSISSYALKNIVEKFNIILKSKPELLFLITE